MAWTTATIRILLDYTLGFWKYRYEVLHMVNEVEGRKTRRKKTIGMVDTYVAKKNEIGRGFDYLFRDGLEI